MKKLLLLILFISITFLGYSQYNITQNLGGPTTLVQNPNYGGFRGGLIPYTFSDTTSANSLASLLKLYNGALIYCTADNAVYWRDATNQKWVQLLPSGGTGGLSAWLTTGNFAVPTDVNGYAKFGTFGTNGINVITSGNTVFKIHADGIVPDTGTVQGLGVNSYGELSYFSGGATPTWQQVLTAGSVLTTDNFVTVSAGTQFTLAGTGGTGGRAAEVEIRTDQASLQASRFGGFSSSLGVTSDSIVFELADGKANINPGFGHGLRSDTDTIPNKPMTYDPTTGMWKYLTYWPNSSSTSISSLTAAAANNTISNANYTQQWGWALTGGNVALSLVNTTTTALGNEKVFEISTNGSHGSNNITTFGQKITNSHTGTGSINIALQTQAVNGDENIAFWANRGKSRFGTNGTEKGVLEILGNTSGTITFQPQAAAGTYNWNWPTTAGTSGYLLTSGGGGSTAMTWTNPASFGMAIGNTVTSATAGSIFFAGTGGTLQQKNSTLFFDSTNIELGLGTNSPASLFNAIAGVCDFRFSKGLSDVTPAMTVINTSGMAGGLLAGTSGAAFVYDNAGPFYLISENHSAFVNNQLGGGSVRMTLTATGELGINTISPSEKLEVDGNAKVSGKFIGRNIIYRTLNASDADFTAAVGTAYVLPDPSTGRTITLPTGQDADKILFYLPVSPSNSWNLSTNVTIPDGSTVNKLDAYGPGAIYLIYDGANSVWRLIPNM